MGWYSLKRTRILPALIYSFYHEQSAATVKNLYDYFCQRQPSLIATKAVAGFEFRSYRRQFKHFLQTSHGEWHAREGIILRLADAGVVGFGEIAPLSWFGSESFEQALDFCHQLPGEITAETILSIPSVLPSCQFGFESAWEDKHPGTLEMRPLTYSGLLPTGEAALQGWQRLWSQGDRTFKWKIGVAPLHAEIKIFQDLVQVLPPTAKLRLDGNGGLSWQSANEWLGACDQCDPAKIEFLEQPLPVDQLDAMLQLGRQYSTPIALDESVATLDKLAACYQRGWRGIFVIKPAIAGSPSRLRQFCQVNKIDIVFSSVFETAIGRQAALKLAAELSGPNRAVGFGVGHWFEDDLEQPATFEQIWQSL